MCYDPVQPPSGGCVLKRVFLKNQKSLSNQPPSGGCVLKLLRAVQANIKKASRLQAAVC